MGFKSFNKRAIGIFKVIINLSAINEFEVLKNFCLIGKIFDIMNLFVVGDTTSKDSFGFGGANIPCKINGILCLIEFPSGMVTAMVMLIKIENGSIFNLDGLNTCIRHQKVRLRDNALRYRKEW